MNVGITFILLACSCAALAQHAEIPVRPSNSFENDYRHTNPPLVYSYDEVTQTHDYSNNWDFDRDGVNDEVYFGGTHGAHLYFSLKVVLSADHITREFDFIQTDFPYLTATDTVDIQKMAYGFIVADIGENQTPSIIVRLDDQTYFANKRALKRRNITTRNALISFEDGVTKFGSLQ